MGANWIYCGSGSEVDANGTQSLLRDRRAIWCSPPGLRPWPATPQPAEPLWLVWRQADFVPDLLLLGGGKIQQAPRQLFGTNLLWTNPDAQGLRAAAVRLGYEGPTSRSFLRLQPVVLPTGQPPIQIDGVHYGLNLASPDQIAALAS
jgi:hypothetical protein